MIRKEAIKDRDNNKPTLYYPAGEVTPIPDIGEFPSLIQRVSDDSDDAQLPFKLPDFIGYDPSLRQKDDDVFDIEARFKLAAITADFVYYLDDEDGDDTGNVVMLTREMKLVSDNFLAANDLVGLVEKNEGLLWISDVVQYWQREQYVKPEQITNEVNKKLEEVDLDKLTVEEKNIFFAYMQGGPIKYTKAESLMAVMANDLEEFSDQLAAIKELLLDNED